MISFVDLNQMVLALIFMDVLIVIIFSIFLWKSKNLNIQDALQKKMDVFESLLADAENMSIHLKKNLEETYSVIKHLDEKLDSRVKQLQELSDNADRKIKSIADACASSSAPELTQEQKILQMANDGLDFEDIAGRLSIPRGTVKMVMELKKAGKK
jgi:DNA-binding NarL/FixJ family response regulator